jgi:coenzyme F420-reducing hydrogenase beta subunit
VRPGDIICSRYGSPQLWQVVEVYTRAGNPYLRAKAVSDGGKEYAEKKMLRRDDYAVVNGAQLTGARYDVE